MHKPIHAPPANGKGYNGSNRVALGNNQYKPNYSLMLTISKLDAMFIGGLNHDDA